MMVLAMMRLGLRGPEPLDVGPQRRDVIRLEMTAIGRHSKHRSIEEVPRDAAVLESATDPTFDPLPKLGAVSNQLRKVVSVPRRHVPLE
jgi:hypothetical protein